MVLENSVGNIIPILSETFPQKALLTVLYKNLLKRVHVFIKS